MASPSSLSRSSSQSSLAFDSPSRNISESLHRRVERTLSIDPVSISHHHYHYHQQHKDTKYETSHEDKPISKQDNIINTSGSLADALEYIGKAASSDTNSIDEEELQSTLPKNRRELQELLENKSLEEHTYFVDELNQFMKQLDEAYADIENVYQTTTTMESELAAAVDASKPFLSEYTSLKSELDTVISQEEEEQEFLQKFQLSAEEREQLENGEPDDIQFLQSLISVSTKRLDCEHAVESGSGTAGFEVLEEISEFHDAALRRLYEFLHSTINNSLSSMATMPCLPLAFCVISVMLPTLAKTLEEEMVQVGGSRVVRELFEAITEGSSGPPIEMQAHDPIRYVGDLLAWVHQCVAAEREFMHSVFEGESQIWKEIEDFIDRDAGKNMGWRVLNGTISALCPQIETRILGIITDVKLELSEVPLLYKAANMIHFYAQTISKLIVDSSTCELVQFLLKMKGRVMEHLHKAIEKHNADLNNQPPEVPSSLSPPFAITRALGILSQINDIFNQSFVDDSGEVSSLLGVTIDGLLDSVELSSQMYLSNKAATSSNITNWSLLTSDTVVYLINCLKAVDQCLSKNKVAKRHQQKVEDQLQEAKKRLITLQVDHILESCGIEDKLENIKQYNRNEKPDYSLCNIEGMDEDSIRGAIQTFYSSIAAVGSLVVPTPHVDRIKDSTLRSQIRNHIASILHQDYIQLFEAIRSPASGYDQPASIVTHSPESIAFLLNLDQ